MKIDFNKDKICASGTWLYDESVPCKVIFVEEDVWPAFYDPNDMDEEREIPCISVWYQNPRGSISEHPDGGYFHTLEEAKIEIEKMLNQKIQWDE